MTRMIWIAMMMLAGLMMLGGCGEKIEDYSTMTYSQADAHYQELLTRLYEDDTTQALERVLSRSFEVAVEDRQWWQIEEVYRRCKRFELRSEEVIGGLGDEVLQAMLDYDFKGIRSFDRAEHVYRQTPSRELQREALNEMFLSCRTERDFQQYRDAEQCYITAVAFFEVKGYWPYDLADGRWPIVDPRDPLMMDEWD